MWEICIYKMCIVVCIQSCIWYGISLSGSRPGDVDRGTYRLYLHVYIAWCELEPNLSSLTHASPPRPFTMGSVPNNIIDTKPGRTKIMANRMMLAS